MTRVSHVDKAGNALELGPPCHFDLGKPVLVRGHPFSLRHAEPGKIWVDQPLTPLAQVGDAVVRCPRSSMPSMTNGENDGAVTTRSLMASGMIISSRLQPKSATLLDLNRCTLTLTPFVLSELGKRLKPPLAWMVQVVWTLSKLGPTSSRVSSIYTLALKTMDVGQSKSWLDRYLQ